MLRFISIVLLKITNTTWVLGNIHGHENIVGDGAKLVFALDPLLLVHTYNRSGFFDPFLPSSTSLVKYVFFLKFNCVLRNFMTRNIWKFCSIIMGFEHIGIKYTTSWTFLDALHRASFSWDEFLFATIRINLPMDWFPWLIFFSALN